MKPLSTTNSTVRFKPAPFAETKTRSNSNAITISKYTKRNETKTKGKDIHHDFHFPIQINETKLKKAIFFFPRLVIWTRFQRGERLGSEGTRHKRPFSFPGRASRTSGRRRQPTGTALRSWRLERRNFPPGPATIPLPSLLSSKSFSGRPPSQTRSNSAINTGDRGPRTTQSTEQRGGRTRANPSLLSTLLVCAWIPPPEEGNCAPPPLPP
jgi:hypothetical protein